MRVATIIASTVAGVTALCASAPPSQYRSTSLGGHTLRDLVKEAARLDASNTLDLRGITWLEHVNLVVGSKPQAETFYQDFLGFTRDPDAKFHVNLGQQQFHLAENGEPAQRVTGSIGLIVPDLDTVRKRAAEAAAVLRGTQFEVLHDDVERGCISVSCPWGNRLHLYCASRDDAELNPTSTSSHKMVKLHSDGGSYSADRMAVRGQPGIRYVEIACRLGTVPAIARFYEEMLGCTVSTLSEGQVAVSVGPGVHLLFVESAALSEDDCKAMEGVHICIYAHDFQSLYSKLATRDLIWTNPRFTHLDSCDTWEEAAASRTLRFKDVIDLENGEKLLELEHETRPLRHGQYLKVPHYVAK